MTSRYYHGTRTGLTVRDRIAPAARSADEAIWSAELGA
jgi:hypothetical protein